MLTIFKPKRVTKSVGNVATKVIEKNEMLVITPDSGSGKGKCQLKFGDGVTGAKDLPIAIDGENADDMKVSAFTTASDQNPVLKAGDTIKVLLGKIVKKFTYLETLVASKFNKSDLYDALDSTSTEKAATANIVRQVNEKTNNNATQITKLTSDLTNVQNLYPAGTAKLIADIGASKMQFGLSTNANELSVYWDGTWLANIPLINKPYPGATVSYFDCMRLIPNGDKFDLHVYDGTGTWLCKFTSSGTK